MARVLPKTPCDNAIPREALVQVLELLREQPGWRWQRRKEGEGRVKFELMYGIADVPQIAKQADKDAIINRARKEVHIAVVEVKVIGD